MATDPYAGIAKPVTNDPYASIAKPAQQPPAATASQIPKLSIAEKAGQGLKDFGTGLLKGGASTLSNIDSMVSKIPGVGNWLTTPLAGETSSQDAQSHLADYAIAHGTAQKLGKGIEQAAEFLIPGGLEEHAAETLGTKAPTLAKMAASAVGGGTINKLQGGSFEGGAAGGAAGAGVAAGLKKLAPVVAEAALGVRGTDRAYGRTPGQSILNETTGISPGSIAKQAGDKVSEYSTQLEDAARDSPGLVDLQPARDTANSWMQSAFERNNDATKKQISKIGEQLDARGDVPIPQFVPAHEGLMLKRGLGDLRTSWNPATATDFSNSAVDSTLHSLHPELENAIPSYRDLNGKISSLMPVAKRATAKDLNAGFVQRSLGRLGAHTGALVGAGAGGAFGYREGGIPGALAGATLGVAGPELLSSPEFQIGAARLLDSSATPRLVAPLAQGGITQASRPTRKRGLYGTQ